MAPSKSAVVEAPDVVSAPAELVVGLAEIIGMDVVNEPQYLWIAEEASRAPLPEDWKELTNEDGETLYYHMIERRLQKEHPLIERYKKLYHKTRGYAKQVVQGIAEGVLETPDHKLNGITATVMNRASKALPPATPEIVEGLANLLNVDSTKEYYLVRCVKQTLEAYVEKKFELSTFLMDLQEPVEFLQQIRKKQNQVDVIRKPNSIFMCQECEKKAAVVKCEQCKDYFCQDCFNSTHATGKRRARSLLMWSSSYVQHMKIESLRASAFSAASSTRTRASYMCMHSMLLDLTCEIT